MGLASRYGSGCVVDMWLLSLLLLGKLQFLMFTSSPSCLALLLLPSCNTTVAQDDTACVGRQLCWSCSPYQLHTPNQSPIPALYQLRLFAFSRTQQSCGISPADARLTVAATVPAWQKANWSKPHVGYLPLDLPFDLLVSRPVCSCPSIFVLPVARIFAKQPTNSANMGIKSV